MTDAAASHLGLRSACQTVAAIARGDTTARAECDAAIARIEAMDGAVNAVVLRDFDRARAAADDADRRVEAGERAPLLGLPMTVKEAFDVAGLPTSWGFVAHRGNVVDSDADAVARLKAAGAIILGKTNVPAGLSEWQSVNDIHGRTSHPQFPDRTPGGSSGGSAAALAGGMVALELGSDIGGSIRVPAHFCGIWGHKPTYGAVSTYGHRYPGTDGAAGPMGVAGPMARGADDLMLAMRLLSDIALPEAGEANLAGLRVLLLTSHPLAMCAQSIRSAAEHVGEVLRQEGSLVDLESPLLPDLAAQHGGYMKLMLIGLSRGAPGIGGREASLREWFDLLDQQARNARAWAALFTQYDAVIAPCLGLTAYPHRAKPSYSRDMLEIDGVESPLAAQFAWPGLATFPDLPATAFPVGRDEAGLPIGLQLIGPRHSDLRVIALAGRIAQALG